MFIILLIAMGIVSKRLIILLIGIFGLTTDLVQCTSTEKESNVISRLCNDLQAVPHNSTCPEIREYINCYNDSYGVDHVEQDGTKRTFDKNENVFKGLKMFTDCLKNISTENMLAFDASCYTERLLFLTVRNSVAEMCAAIEPITTLIEKYCDTPLHFSIVDPIHLHAETEKKFCNILEGHLVKLLVLFKPFMSLKGTSINKEELHSHTEPCNEHEQEEITASEIKHTNDSKVYTRTDIRTTDSNREFRLTDNVDLAGLSDVLKPHQFLPDHPIRMYPIRRAPVTYDNEHKERIFKRQIDEVKTTNNTPNSVPAINRSHTSTAIIAGDIENNEIRKSQVNGTNSTDGTIITGEAITNYNTIGFYNGTVHDHIKIISLNENNTLSSTVNIPASVIQRMNDSKVETDTSTGTTDSNGEFRFIDNLDLAMLLDDPEQHPSNVSGSETKPLISSTETKIEVLESDTSKKEDQGPKHVSFVEATDHHMKEGKVEKDSSPPEETEDESGNSDKFVIGFSVIMLVLGIIIGAIAVTSWFIQKQELPWSRRDQPTNDINLTAQTKSK